MKQQTTDLIHDERIWVCDGAMGTMIQESGLDAAVCPEAWNRRDPRAIEAIHRAYRAAGADLLETNTFGGSPIKLGEYGLKEDTYELNQLGAANARRALGTGGLVAGSVGPTGALFRPMGQMSFEDAFEAYRQQIRGLADGGADLILIETMMEILETKAALLAARDAAPHLPVICQMTFAESGMTVMGTTPEIAATVLESLGADLIGVNCSTGPDGLLDVVRRMGETTHLPLSVQPNAGLPEVVDGRTVYRETPEHMASFAERFVQAGAKLLGGCCGSKPEHIGAIAEAARPLRYQPRADRGELWLCSRNRRVRIDAGNPWFATLRSDESTREALAAGRMKVAVKPLRKAMKSGAQGIHVELDEACLNPAAVDALMQALSGPLSVPLAVSCRAGRHLEHILREAPGNVLLVDVPRDEADTVLSLARRYGCALALPDPDVLRERARTLGIPDKRILDAREVKGQDTSPSDVKARITLSPTVPRP